MSKKVKKSKEEPKELSRLEEVLSTFNNLSGNAGNIVLLDDDAFIQDIPVIPSGILTLDYLLGVAGYPHGRIIELYGAESCIDGDSYLAFDVWSNKQEKYINRKGGSIRRLYERFHKVKDGASNYGRHLQDNDATFYVKSVNSEGYVVSNQVLDVVKTGEKQCYLVKTLKGKKLISTAEHKFMTPSGFVALGDLKVGDEVYVHCNERCKGRKSNDTRPALCVKYHPYFPTKTVRCNKVGKDYLYYRGQISRIAYEAHLNNMTYDDYVEYLNTQSKENIDKLKFIPKDFHIHHKDENFLNNDISNLDLIDPSTHGMLHSKDRLRKLSFIAVPTQIVSIEEVGLRETYDLKCLYPYNNYIAEGVVVHNSGKTTICLHAMASCQQNGGIGAFIDAEHALDVRYANNLGVNTGKLLISQPNSGEEALNAVEQLAKLLGHGDLIVIDSVAALTPQAELDGEMGDHHMGLHARLMSQALRKITAIVAKTGVTVIFVNQTRMKIGVMFGCFHYDTLVNLADGRSLPIGEIVDNKIEGSVYCWNEVERRIEVKPIIDWHDNGKVSDNSEFIHVQTQSINGRGRFGFTCTPNHQIKTLEGWKAASDITIQDKLISKYEETINGTYKDFLMGSLVGDSCISTRYANTAALTLQNNENPAYMEWKASKLRPFLNFTVKKLDEDFYRYQTDYSYELARMSNLIGHRDPMVMLRAYTDLSLAVWIMDDGCLDLKEGHCRYLISIKRFKNNANKLEEIRQKFESLDLICRPRLNDGSITFNAESTREIARRICRWVPECMQYKLPEESRGLYQEFQLSNNPRLVIEPVEVKLIREASNRQMRNKRKFDITVQDNHNYMIGGLYNGVIAHNSPITTTGGNALKFYATQRLEIKRGKVIKKGEDPIGCSIMVKIAKNKVAPPFREGRLEMRFGQGIPKALECLILGTEHGFIEKNGNHYHFNGQALGNGIENAYQTLLNSPEAVEYIDKELRKRLFQKA